MNHNEHWWISACLHIIYCWKEHKQCVTCTAIHEAIRNERPAIGDDYLKESIAGQVPQAP